MAICEYVNCKGTYKPIEKLAEVLLLTKCHDDWHYHQKKPRPTSGRGRGANEQARLEGR